jgi:branched-subunit amino acid ABC-type transport system permease component
MAISNIIQILLFGLIEGSIIAIGALGLTLSYGVTRFINFAYGEFLTYGAFLTLFLSLAGMPLAVAGLVSALLIGWFGVIVAKVAYEPLTDRGPISLLIASIGVSFLLRNSLRAGVGTSERSYDVPLLQPLSFGDIFIGKVAVGVFIVAIVTLMVLYFVLQKTMLGKKMRATSSNRQLATISGVDTDSLVDKVWFISAGIGGLCGILLALQFSPFRPGMGWNFLIVVFAATILGGIGRPRGAVIGALVVGVAMNLGTFYFSSSYTFAYAFAILVVALLFKPEGIVTGEF